MTRNLERRNLINVPPKLIEALGQVSARYGQIEHLLTMTIHRTARLSYDDSVAEVDGLRHRKDIKKRAEQFFDDWALQNFGEIEGKKRIDAFHDLIQNWADLAERRDNVIHCCWSVGTKDKHPTGTRKGELLTTDGRPFGIEDVEKLGDNLKQFVIRLNGATMPNQVFGPEEEIAAMPDKFSVRYIMPSNLETTATAAATVTPSGVSKEPFDD